MRMSPVRFGTPCPVVVSAPTPPQEAASPDTASLAGQLKTVLQEKGLFNANRLGSQKKTLLTASDSAGQHVDLVWLGTRFGMVTRGLLPKHPTQKVDFLLEPTLTLSGAYLPLERNQSVDATDDAEMGGFESAGKYYLPTGYQASDTAQTLYTQALTLLLDPIARERVKNPLMRTQ